uniref:Uncharacterized protein n=1 Tax=Anguilla anguilla TaxID=7936 RepID=A0A0E9XIM1_ANGAN
MVYVNTSLHTYKKI